MLEDLTAFVTGASGGIGREIAYELGAQGANVTCAARGDGIYETADELGDSGLAVETDVTDEESVEAAVAATVEEFGGLDCLVNNAGISGPVQPLHQLDPDDVQETLAVNVTGAVTCAKHADPHLRESERGSVVNIGSIGGKRPYPNRIPYAASKMGLIGVTRTLTYELGRDGVTVNTVLPGPVAGDRIDDVIEKQAELADVENAEPASIGPDDFALPNYVVEPEEIAEQVAYLAGPSGRHISGQEIALDAGGTWY